MKMSKSKTSVALVAAILIGAGVFAFVAYTAFDAIGFGTTVENGDSYAPTWGTNQTIPLSFSPESQPVVTYWDALGAVNGTVSTTNLTWNGGNTIYVWCDSWVADVTTGVNGVPYGKDTTYLRFNYTGRGSAARAIVMPAIILVAVFAIVVVAAVMTSSSSNLSGKKGGKKSFP
jgi:hypothetical protein